MHKSLAYINKKKTQFLKNRPEDKKIMSYRYFYILLDSIFTTNMKCIQENMK